MSNVRWKLLGLLCFTGAFVGGWWWLDRPPSLQALGKEISISFPASATMSEFVRIDPGVDVVFAAEVKLDPESAKAFCDQNRLEAGPPEAVPDELLQQLPRPWYLRSICHRRVMNSTGWQFVFVTDGAVVVYVHDL